MSEAEPLPDYYYPVYRSPFAMGGWFRTAIVIWVIAGLDAAAGLVGGLVLMLHRDHACDVYGDCVTTAGHPEFWTGIGFLVGTLANAFMLTVVGLLAAQASRTRIGPR